MQFIDDSLRNCLGLEDLDLALHHAGVDRHVVDHRRLLKQLYLLGVNQQACRRRIGWRRGEGVNKAERDRYGDRNRDGAVLPSQKIHNGSKRISRRLLFRNGLNTPNVWRLLRLEHGRPYRISPFAPHVSGRLWQI